MKTIKITSINKSKLDELKEGKESYDKLLNRLIDNVGDDMPVMNLNDRVTNIGVHDDTLARLDSFALTKSEPYENIILRLLFKFKE